MLKKCLEIWHSVILLANMGVFIAVNENMTDGDIAITGDTITCPWCPCGANKHGLGR